MNPEALLSDLKRATDAVFALAMSLSTAQATGDEWTRMPSQNGGRCPVSGWSYSSLFRRIKAGEVRAKHVGRSRYYSASDVRKIIETQTAPTP